jgi:FtsZ-interacting cell division protein ZipA
LTLNAIIIKIKLGNSGKNLRFNKMDKLSTLTILIILISTLIIVGVWVRRRGNKSLKIDVFPLIKTEVSQEDGKEIIQTQIRVQENTQKTQKETVSHQKQVDGKKNSQIIE